MSTTLQSKHQWQSKTNNFRRIVVHSQFFDSADASILYYDKAILSAAIEEFKNTPKHLWIEQNSIKLHYETNENAQSYSRQLILYAYVSEREFLDYSLRF